MKEISLLGLEKMERIQDYAVLMTEKRFLVEC